MTPCPVCHRQGALLLAAASGFWERHVLSRLGVQPYRCRACGNRILRREGSIRRTEGQPGSETSGRPRARPRPLSQDLPVPTTEERFLTSGDGPQFDELIRQLKETETRRGLAEGADSVREAHDP